MEEKNELNDIILNKGASSAGNKKIILAVATLGVILIIVVMLMNTISSNGTDNLPQAILPPQPQTTAVTEEPLFEEVEVVQEGQESSDSLDKIAQKLKEESNKEVEKVVVEEAPKAVVKKATPKKVTTQKVAPKTAATGDYYIQVGSFSKYEPNKKFLDSITKQGYKYKYHKVSNNSKTLTKVLVGPFATEKEARKALITVRTFLEAGAFLIKL